MIPYEAFQMLRSVKNRFVRTICSYCNPKYTCQIRIQKYRFWHSWCSNIYLRPAFTHFSTLLKFPCHIHLIPVFLYFSLCHCQFANSNDSPEPKTVTIWVINSKTKNKNPGQWTIAERVRALMFQWAFIRSLALTPRRCVWPVKHFQLIFNSFYFIHVARLAFSWDWFVWGGREGTNLRHLIFWSV